MFNCISPQPSTTSPSFYQPSTSSSPSTINLSTTYLELRSLAALKPKSTTDPLFRIEEAKIKQWKLNRFLYSLVGADWQWNDKLPWTDDQWRQYVEDDRLRTFLGLYGGSIAGYCELRRDDAGDQEIAYFGLAPQFVGRGLGGPLLTHALQEALRTSTSRVWVHTCNLDHPSALPNYLARGMTIFKVKT